MTASVQSVRPFGWCQCAPSRQLIGPVRSERYSAISSADTAFPAAPCHDMSIMASLQATWPPSCRWVRLCPRDTPIHIDFTPESASMKTTVIGLGAMGAGMAGNLFRAGHLSHAWNRSPERAQAAAAQHGFALADSLEAAAGQADLVITSVPQTPTCCRWSSACAGHDGGQRRPGHLHRQHRHRAHRSPNGWRHMASIFSTPRYPAARKAPKRRPWS